MAFFCAMWCIKSRLGPVDIHRNAHSRMSRQLGTEVNGDARYQRHAGLGVGLLFEGRAASETLIPDLHAYDAKAYKSFNINTLSRFTVSACTWRLRECQQALIHNV